MPSWWSRTTWYGPATSAVMYGLMRGRRREVHGLAGATARRPTTSRPLEHTCQSSGAVTWKVNVGLQVGLVEAGVHPLGVGGLELRVQVDLAVDRVDEPVQALAGVRVEQSASTTSDVLGRQVGQHDAVLGRRSRTRPRPRR